jgi:hypothetical protein
MTEMRFGLTFTVAAPFWALLTLLPILFGPLGLGACLAVRPRWAPDRDA